MRFSSFYCLSKSSFDFTGEKETSWHSNIWIYVVNTIQQSHFVTQICKY